METEDSEEEKVNDSGVRSEIEERQDLENNNLATPIHLKGKVGSREASKVFGEDIKPRIKKKKVIKEIFRKEEEEELK